MLAYLSRTDVILWIIMAGLQLLLSSLLLWRRDVNYPAFKVFIYYQAIKSPALMLLSSTAWAYFWSYYASSVICCVLMAVATGEIYMNVFGPNVALPGWVPRSVAAWLAGAVSSCGLLAFALRPLGPNRYLTLMSGIQSALISALLMSLIILVFYSRYLGLTWRRGPALIAAGFIFFLMINANTFFVLGLASRQSAAMARTIGMAAYIISLLWWGVALFRREPVPEKATAEQVAQMLEHHRKTVCAAAVISGTQL